MKHKQKRDMVKIKDCRIGVRGRVSLPPIWLHDNGVNAGDIVEVYRCVGKPDDLVIQFKRREEHG